MPSTGSLIFPIFSLLYLLTSFASAVDVLVVVNSDQEQHVSKLVQKTSSDSLRRHGFEFGAVTFTLDSSVGQNQAFERLCSRLEDDNVSVIISLARDRPTNFVIATVAGRLGIPVLGYLPKSYGNLFLDVNKYFIDFSPVSKELAWSLVKFLETNYWYSITLVLDGSISSSLLQKYMEYLMSDNVRKRVNTVKVLSADRVRSSLSDLESIPSRIVILHCDRNISKHIFYEASDFNLLSNDWVWIVSEDPSIDMVSSFFSNNTSLEGILGIRPRHLLKSRHLFRSVIKVLLSVLKRIDLSFLQSIANSTVESVSCSSSQPLPKSRRLFLKQVHRELKRELEKRQNSSSSDSSFYPVYDILNFVRSHRKQRLLWRNVGNVSALGANFDSVTWLGNSKRSPQASYGSKVRVVTAIAPPFVMPSPFLPNSSICLRGVMCAQVDSNDKDRIAYLLSDFETKQSLRGISYNVTCCVGLSIDLLERISKDLKFDYTLYLVADNEFGVRKNQSWTGLTGDLVSGAAHLAFSAFSITNSRAKAIDFSVPYHDTDISCLAVKQYEGVPLAAFLIPFSIDLWIMIVASLHAAAIAAAIYEWLSPFGLNPWGRQRTKNFTLASALWVMWSLLFSHLVAFKAPKSWPNKVLINLWGCFSVIFLASYTANIAALFAGLFFQAKINHIHDSFLMSHNVGTFQGSSTEIYILNENPRLYQRLQQHAVSNMEDGLKRLYDKSMDILIGDTAIFDYFRGWSVECNLSILGQALYHDSYAIGMPKNSPMKDPISSMLIRYSEVGYIDSLREKWYGDMPCFERAAMLTVPSGLSPSKVRGVFMVLACGFLVGFIILIVEHFVFKYFLPELRMKSKKSFWKSPNLMFFSQKLYRFINCVELVSPHHSAKEIASNLRAGQIFSLFQKSVKRKAKEDARRRKSKSLFFDMIQEVTRRTKQNELSSQDHKGFVSQNRRSSSRSFDKRRNNQESEIELLSRDDTLETVESGLVAELYRPKEDRSKKSTEECTENSFLISNRNRQSSYSIEDLLDPFSSSICCKPISVSLNDVRTKCNDEPSNKVRILSDSDVKKYKEKCTLNDDPVPKKSIADCTLIEPFSRLKIDLMNKEQIVAVWMESELELRRKLQDVTREKQSLESKLLYLQSCMRKPP